jgi:hypothetical protein
MPRILILGATGHIGNNLCNLLVRSGQHTVYGLARTPEKAEWLARREIVPVLGSDPVNDPSAYVAVLRSVPIDVVVDLTTGSPSSYKFLKTVKQVGEERIKQLRVAGITKGPKLGFIYCSGSWVHGSSDSRDVSDLDIVGPSAVVPPVKLMSWRVDLEQQVLVSDDILGVMVMRPAQLYGRESPDWSHFVLPILKAVQSDMGAAERGNGDGSQSTTDHIKIPLDPDSKLALIHMDDTASSFMKAIEKLPIISGTGVYPVFDLATS